MKKKNKKIAAGTLLCALTSTGLTGVQASAAGEESRITKAAKECKSDIVKTGLAITGGALAIDRISDSIPSTAKKIIGKLGDMATYPLKLARHPIKRIGGYVIDKISEMPPLLLIGGITMVGYSIMKILDKHFENRVKEEVEKKTKNANGNSKSITININKDKN